MPLCDDSLMATDYKIPGRAFRRWHRLDMNVISHMIITFQSFLT